MQKKYLKNILTSLLISSMVILPVSVSFALGQYKSAEEIIETVDAPINKGEFAELINTTFGFEEIDEVYFLDADTNHPYGKSLAIAKKSGYFNGDGTGNIFPEKVLSGWEAVTVINNILGFDPSLVQTVDVNIVDWAKPSASIILDLQIIKKELIEKETLTVEDALHYIESLQTAKMYEGGTYGLKQTTLEDDFYAYTNRAYLANKTIPLGYMNADTFSDVNLVIEKREEELLNDILKNTFEEQSSEWKIQETYKMYMDTEAKEKNLDLIKPYIDEINKIKTIEELQQVASKNVGLFPTNPLYTMMLNSDAKKDATEWAVLVYPSSLSLGTAEYYGDSEEVKPIQNAFKSYLVNVLKYIGETEDLETRADKIIEFETMKSKHQPSTVELSDSTNFFNETTWDEFNQSTKNTLGFESYTNTLIPNLKTYPLYNGFKDYVTEMDKTIIEENLQVYKDLRLIDVFGMFASELPDDAKALSDELAKAMFGQVPERMPLEQRARQYAISTLPLTFSQLYADNFTTKEMKKDMENMFEDIRKTFKKRINALDWMSPTTKKEAINKLENINAHLVSSDIEISDRHFDLISKENGGDLIKFKVSLAQQTPETYKLLEESARISPWDSIPTNMVNAFYNPTSNEIVVPAGILNAPFYDINASREENLGGIGAVIAHEITHAFDSMGSQFDKDGTMTNWWTEEDFAAFNKRVNKMSASLSKIQLTEGMFINGDLCKGETIADLGGLECVMDIVKSNKTLDPKVLMESWATIWAMKAPSEMVGFMINIDPHSPNFARTNFTLSQLDEFYEVYDIEENDGMYIPLEDRNPIW